MMTVEQRVAIWEELQREFAIMEESAMRRRYPEFDDGQILVELVRPRYGDELGHRMLASGNALVA
ncbi:MAG: hypothetical protein FJW19_07115 [Actinobacteria bacterium]|nr:hypothetical protein [Actinomycetota bacterium]